MKNYDKLITYLALLSAIIFFMLFITKEPKADTKRETQMLIFNFQGCEYIKYKDTIIHKGNCTNEVHNIRKD